MSGLQYRIVLDVDDHPAEDQVPHQALVLWLQPLIIILIERDDDAIEIGQPLLERVIIRSDDVHVIELYQSAMRLHHELQRLRLGQRFRFPFGHMVKCAEYRLVDDLEQVHVDGKHFPTVFNRWI